MGLWKINDEQAAILLGRISHSTYYYWKKTYNGKLSYDQLCRISLILGIYKNLQILFPDIMAADSWIKQLFAGQSALDAMLGGNYEDLFKVRQYLETSLF